MLIFFISLLVIYFGNIYMKYYFNYSTLSRITLEDQEDVKALTSRINFYYKAYDLFISSPYFGVGLAHYPLIGNQPYGIYKPRTKESEIAAKLVGTGPHNIFLGSLAETGIIGTIPLMFFILICLKNDLILFYNIKNRFNENKLISLSFWLLFSFALLHPEIGFHFYALLFSFRAINSNIK